jgi:NADH:ubiquinone oxidoreductase subunit E
MGKDSMDRKDKLNLKSSSTMFREWVTQMDSVLSKVETHKLDGSLLTKEDSAFHNARTVLAECAVQCKAAPAYVINEWVASDLIEDEIESRDAEMEKDER